MKDGNILTYLKNRARTGLNALIPNRQFKHHADVNKIQTDVRAILEDASEETVSKLAKSFEKKSEQSKSDIENIVASSYNALQGFQIADLAKKSFYSANIVTNNPLLFSRLAHNHVIKLGYPSSQIALGIIRGEICSNQPEHPTRDARKRNIMDLAMRHEIVAIEVFKTPALIQDLTDRDLSALKEKHSHNNDLSLAIQNEIETRSLRGQVQKRTRPDSPCSSLYLEGPPKRARNTSPFSSPR